MILSLDPSKTATGWVIFDPEKQRVVSYGCFKASLSSKERKKYTRKTEIYKKEQARFIDFLTTLKVKYSIRTIVAEYPHGSQSSTSAWALSMVNATIGTFAKLVLGVPAVTYLESDCKKGWFGRAKGVQKEDTMDAMLKVYGPKGYEPRKHNGNIVKYEHEAVSDSLLVLTTYLNDG